MRRTAVKLLCVVGALVTGAGPAQAAHHRPAGPYLYVAHASVRLSSGVLRGSLTVANRGGRTAGRSVAALSVITGRGIGTTWAFAMPRLRSGAAQKLKVAERLPRSTPFRRLALEVCVPARLARHGRLPGGRCKRIGTILLIAPRPKPTTTTSTSTSTTTRGPTTTTTTSATQTQTATTSTSASPNDGAVWTNTVKVLSPPASQVPSAPLNPQADPVDSPVELGDGVNDDYFAMVPPSYDQTNRTPERLLVWLHGCNDAAQNDVYWMAPTYTGYPQYDRPWIAISVSAAEPDNQDGCWDTSPGCGDCQKVINAIYDAETHFNIDRRRIILAGYSSGGDMAYRVGFDRSSLFAGLLIENSSPFRDTGSTAAQSLAAASWKLPIIHLAHEEDQTYPLAGVQSEIQTVQNAGFPVTFLHVPGDHGTAATAQQIEDDFTNDVYLGQPQWIEDWEAPAP